MRVAAVIPVVILVLVGATGCPPSIPFYKDQLVTLQYQGGGKLAAATVDARPYVKSSISKWVTFEGQDQSAFGAPRHKATTSGEPLASAMNRALVGSLQGHGFVVTSVNLEPQTAQPDIAAEMVKSAPDMAVVLRIKEWTYKGFNVEHAYDLDLDVLDAQGQVLASASRQKRIKWDTMDWVKKARFAKASFQSVLGELLSDGRVAEALQGRAPSPAARPAVAPAAVPPPAVGGDRSVEQRLQELEELKKKGLLSEEEYQKKKAEILKDL